jgi:heme A synthase
MDVLAFLHGYGARVLLAFAVVLAIWGTYTYIRNQKLSGGFRSSYLIMAGVTAVQGLVGLGALVLGGHPHGGLLHYVYGIFAVIFLPGAYAYAHGGSARRETVILAGACWIVTIAYLRGISTGG